MYRREESSDFVDSSSSSSSLHCLLSSPEWTLITSLITCRVITNYFLNFYLKCYEFYSSGICCVFSDTPAFLRQFIEFLSTTQEVFVIFTTFTTDDIEAVEISCIRLCTTYFQGILVLDSFPLKTAKTL